MKKVFKSILFVMTACVVTFSACKKKEDDSPKARLQGKWKVEKAASDDNHNNVMDASEIENMTDSITVNITFNGDNTGNMAVSFLSLSQTENFTWTLLNNNTDVNIKYTSGMSVGDEIKFHIDALSKTDATFSGVDTSGGVSTTSWMMLKKQ